jgi:hypothetical protein
LQPRRLHHKAFFREAGHAAFDAVPKHEKARSAILALESGRMPLLHFAGSRGV